MFSYEVHLPFHVKNASLCLYPYNLDSFNIIHEREAFSFIFYLFKDILACSTYINVASKIDRRRLIINCKYK